MKPFIIEVTSPDKADKAYVGPFISEEQADRYCKETLEPHLKGSTFRIVDVESPHVFARLVRG